MADLLWIFSRDPERSCSGNRADYAGALGERPPFKLTLRLSCRRTAWTHPRRNRSRWWKTLWLWGFPSLKRWGSHCDKHGR